MRAQGAYAVGRENMILILFNFIRLFKYSVQQRSQRNGDTDTSHPQLPGASDGGVLGHNGVGLDIEDVALLHIIIR